MARILDATDVVFQADAFAEWCRRQHRAVGASTFDRWARSKDFTPEDRAAIWTAVQARYGARRSA